MIKIIKIFPKAQLETVKPKLREDRSLSKPKLRSTTKVVIKRDRGLRLKRCDFKHGNPIVCLLARKFVRKAVTSSGLAFSLSGRVGQNVSWDSYKFGRFPPDLGARTRKIVAYLGEHPHLVAPTWQILKSDLPVRVKIRQMFEIGWERRQICFGKFLIGRYFINIYLLARILEQFVSSPIEDKS